MTGAACFTELDVYGIDIADLTDSSFAAEGNETDFTAGETYLSVLVLLSEELRRIACGANELCALAGKQLDAVYHSTDGDVPDGKRITDLDVGVFAGDNGLADLQTEGSDDVALFAVSIVQKSDVCALVGVSIPTF